MPMKEDDFKERKRFLESLFMNYSGQINDHYDRERLNYEEYRCYS